MRLNKRQKQLLIESLAKEYKEVSNSLFSMSLYDRKDKIGNFKNRWEELTQRKNDIIFIIDSCKDDILKKVYFTKVVDEINKQQENDYQDFMENR